MSGLFSELKRRNVLRAAGLYLGGAWLLLQIVDTVLPMLSLPETVGRIVLIAVVVGFLPAMALAWAFEWKSSGLQREQPAEQALPPAPGVNRRIDLAIGVLLAMAIGYFAFDKFALAPQRARTDVAAALQAGRAQGVAEAYGNRSIAVLPFRDLSPQHDQAYFSDGIAEQMLDLMSKVDGLRVISRGSSFELARQGIDIPTIAQRLQVAYVLQGSVRKAGGQARVSVQLVEGKTNTEVWSQTFDRPLDDIFAVQDEIAAVVVDRLKVKLLGAVPTVRRTDPQVLQLYLQAVAVMRSHASDAHARGQDLLHQALERDATYIDGWTQLALAYNNRARTGEMPEAEGYAKAEEAARRALAIDPRSGRAHAALADIALAKGKVQQAADSLARAYATAPNDSYVLGLASDLAQALGRLDLAVDILRKMVALDPVRANTHALLCLALLNANRLDEAAQECRAALAIAPNQTVTHSSLSTVLLLQGDPRGALAEAKKEPFDLFRWLGEAMAYHVLGDRARSDASLRQAVDKYAHEAAYNIAYAEAWRGNADAAFEWLGKAVEYKDTGLVMVASDPILKQLNGDPRWLAFLRSQGRAPDQLAAIRLDIDLGRSGDP